MSDLTKLDKVTLNEKLNTFVDSIKDNGNINDSEKLQLLLDNLELHQIELELKNRQLRESQVDLERTRDKYANLYDFSPIGYISFDQKGCIKEINLAACELLGNQRWSLLDKPFSVFLSLEDSQIFFKHIKLTFSETKKVTHHLTLKSKLGLVRHIQLDSINRSSIHNTSNIQTAIIDNTERVIAEQAKLSTENQLRSILESLPVLVAHFDTNFHYLYTNKAYNSVFNLNNQSHINKNMLDVIYPTIYKTLIPFANIAKTGEEVIFETAINISGQNTFFHISMLPQLSKNHDVDRIIMIMMDISAYKQKEYDVKTHLSNVAHEDRINLIGQMTSEIAHEINQPLSAIANYSVAGLQMQKSDNLNTAEIVDILSEIDHQVHRASNIINHLKKFSAKRDLQRANNNINNLVLDVLSLMNVDDPKFNTKMITELDDSIPPIYIDGILVEQVLINIIRNAIEAQCEISDSKSTILISTKLQDNNVVIIIADNGPGLSREMLDTIFTPFYSTKSAGVGLGLSICRSIIDSHNGKLWATNNTQRGTTFFIELPLLNES